MRLRLPLNDLLRGKGTLHVLRTLCLRPGRSSSAPELARAGGLALSHVQGALAVLESHGLVDRHVTGRTHLWSIAAGNTLLPALKALFEAEGRLPEELKRELAAGLRSPSVRRAILFGSISRGEESGWSDVDLLVEIASERQRERVWDLLLPLATRIRQRFGLNLAPIVVTPDQERGSLSPSFLAAVVQGGQVITEGR